MPPLLQLVSDAGLLVFRQPFSANLVVQRGAGGPGDWDGWLTLGYFDEAGGWWEHGWPAATRPGLRGMRHPKNKDGVALIASGQYRLSHRRGLHRGARPALVQVAPVDVWRDGDRDKRLDPDTDKRYRGLFGVNIHDTKDPQTLEGCIGLHTEHLEVLLDVYAQYCEPVSRDVSLTLLERVAT